MTESISIHLSQVTYCQEQLYMVHISLSCTHLATATTHAYVTAMLVITHAALAITHTCNNDNNSYRKVELTHMRLKM